MKNLANAELEEVAYFDVFSENDNSNFNGAWSVYPYFESGNVLISSIEGGLFVVRPDLGTTLTPSTVPTSSTMPSTSAMPSTTPTLTSTPTISCASLSISTFFMGISSVYGNYFDILPRQDIEITGLKIHIVFPIDEIKVSTKM